MTRHPDVGVLQRPDGLPLVVVHGGAEARGYRNVLEALETALVHAADYFELDVRRTADGVLVVHHDEEIGTERVGDLSYADAQGAAAASGYQLPRLEVVLERARGVLRLDVELKESGYESVLLRALRAARFDSADVVVTSFEQPALDAIHAADAAVVTGLLVYDVTGPTALELFQRSGASFLGPDYAILDDETLTTAAAASIPLLPWTVNDRAAMRRLMRADAVRGLITDRPVEALEVREEGS